MTTTSWTRTRLFASTILGGAAALAMVSAAQAQSAPAATPAGTGVTTGSPAPASADAGTTVGEVIVTGSRIARRDYVADSPIVSVSPKAIENTGDVTLERLFNQLPQVLVSNGGQVNNGGNGQVNIALRGIGTTRTLVLMDGRRLTNSTGPNNASNGSVVDLNSIPAALIDSIEVITGGASAAYGSDAVAGVVNFKLKHNFQGIVLDAQYNIAEKGDGEQTAVSATIGGNFGDDRGNAVVSFSYDNRDAVLYGDRQNITTPDFKDFGLTDPRILAVGGLSSSIPQGAAGFLANAGLNAAGNNVAGANTPSQAAVNAVFAKYGAAAGTVAAAANTFFGFNADGTLFYKGVNYKGPTTLDYSTIPTTGVAGTGATGPGAYNTGALNYVLTPQTRYNAYAAAEYAINPHVKAYGQFYFTQFQANTVLAPTPASGNPGTAVGAANTINTGFLVPVTNPYIPADLRTILASRPNPTAPFLFNKRFSEFGARNASIQYTTYQFLTGLKGDIPESGGHDLKYDLYATYGRTDRIDAQTGNLNRTLFRQYLESPTGTLAGCTGYNPFGSNGVSAACQQLFSPATKNLTSIVQRVAEGTVTGKAFDIPDYTSFMGGELRFAFGADYRQDKLASTPDALASGTDQSGVIGSSTTPYNNALSLAGFGAGQGLAGARDVYEVYGELLVPLLKDLPLARSVNLDLGARYSTYNFSGANRETGLNATTYKADIDWKVTNWMLLRGGFSRAIRAPGIGELYTPQQTNFATIGPAGVLGSGDPCDINGAYRKGPNAAAVRALCLAQGVPANVVDIYQGNSLQSPSTSGGNPLLREERANTYTGGVVFQPHFSNPLFARLSASIDYYNISIRGFITPVPFATSLAKCYNTDGSNPTFAIGNQFCQNLVRDTGTGQLSNGFATSQNSGGLKTSGVDVQVDWGFGLSALPFLGLGDKWGALSFNFVASWLNDLDVRLTPTDPYQQNRGTITSQAYTPVWKALLTANYAVGKFDFGVTERYLGDADDSTCIGLTVACTARGVPATFYTNLTARWKMTDALELRAGIDNATDQDPRFFTSGTSSQAFSDGTTYDFIGRRYYVGLKARF